MSAFTPAIQQLYVAYFNRPADFSGLAFWEGVVANAKDSKAALASIGVEFAKSAEYKATFAGLDSAHVVERVYLNLFNRAPDLTGLNFWTQALLTNAMTVDNVVTKIAEGAQNDDLTTLNNKVAAAKAFSASLDTSAEALGYAGDKANAIAKEWLSHVGSDASLAVAIDKTALDAVIQNVVDNGPQPVGQTYTLGLGQDIINGTSGNDTINAYSFNAVTGETDKTTLSSFDSIDGGAGKDTLNLSVTNTANVDATHAINIGTKNVEIINIDESGATLGVAVDASMFAGATQINQISKAGTISNLAVGTTAGFQGAMALAALNVVAAGASAAVSFTGVSDDATLAISGSKLTGVTVSGTRVDGADAGTAVSALTLNVTSGKDVATVTVNSSVAATLTVVENAGNTAGKVITTVDASASTGAIAFNADAQTKSILSGSGNDTITVNTATAAATDTTAAVNASVATGAGNDTVNVNTTVDGATSVDTGAGNDTVNITARSSGKLTVSLGDGSDNFTSLVAVNAGDVIDAGAGSDTLALSLVGSANIGAFSNFDLFDTVGLGTKTLDVDILATKNTVSEIIASGDVGAAAVLTNVGTASFRATGNMGTADFLTLTQKVAGAITLTTDADETGTGNIAADSTHANVVASNATAIKAVFDTSFLADVTGETGAVGDNAAYFDVKGVAASVEIAAGGTNAHDIFTYTDTATGGKLTSVTVTGAQDLTLAVNTAAKLATIDASAQTGGLTTSTNWLADGGTIKLGSGADNITVGSNSVAAGVESLVGFEKTAAVAVSIVAGDATAAADAQANADVLSFGAGVAVAADATITGGTVKNGVLTFTGSGPSDLTAAVTIADGVATGTAVAFEYLGNTYVLEHGAADVIVKLVGVTGVANLGEVGGTSDTFFIV